MKKKNRILTESQNRQITENKEKAILESFTSTFNKIKRIDENKIEKNKFTKIEALEYLVDVGPDNINEWTEAGMYTILRKVILGGDKIYVKEELDKLLEYASNN